jgi:hypothetical protein
MSTRRAVLPMLVAVLAMAAPAAAVAAPQTATSVDATRLAVGLDGGSGSTVGPDGALYVTEGVAGRISRVDPMTGAVSTYASGLPHSIVGIGGAMDVAFLDGTAYVLVTLVGPDVGGTDTVGVYRVDGPDHVSVVADIGAYTLANPPVPPFFVPTGVQYALDVYRGGFLVTDGHHNRVYRVTLDGSVSELIAFDNIVPTGLAVHGRTIYMAEAGPIPHLPENGRIVSFQQDSPTATQVAAGGPLLVDVEAGPGHSLYALAQGIWPVGNAEGSPASPNTGKLLRVNGAGGFTDLAVELDRPTSIEVVGTTAYVVTLTGEVWRFDGIGEPPYSS